MRQFLFMFVMMLSYGLAGQTFVYEDFSGGVMPPQGWTISGFNGQWAISQTDTSDGTVPEGKFAWIQQVGTTRLISPAVDLTDFSSVKLTFRHLNDVPIPPAPSIGVATRNHNGPWTVVYQVTPTLPLGPEKVSVIINNNDVGQSEFQFCIFLDGNFFNMNYYFVDDILLFNPLGLDGALVSLANTSPFFDEPAPVKGTLLNSGLTNITSAEIHWQLNDGPVQQTTFTGLMIQPEQKFDFTCSGGMAGPVGDYQLHASIYRVNGIQDDYVENDTNSRQVSRVSLLTKFRPSYEEFTSSTCFPCANFHKKFTPWCEDHADDITLIKYQMNWPGLGDPYYTLEGGQRKDYYQCSYVPDLYHGGFQSECNISNVNANFAADMQKRGRMKIMATHSFDFHTIQVKATVLPFDDFPNAKIHIVVMERETVNNVRNNGETVFEHVMMKMIPNANGTTVNLIDRVPVTVTDTVDLTGTHVEEWDDLIVAVFVQNFNSREVYQSDYSLEDGTPAGNANLSGIFIDGQPLQGFTPGQFDYTVFLPAGTTVIPEVTAQLSDTNATLILIPAYTLPGTATMDVFGEDLIAHNQYSVSFVVQGLGITQTTGPMLRIYPNPARERIFFSAPIDGRIRIYSSTGELVADHTHFIGNDLVTGEMAPGIYMILIEQPGMMPSARKLMVVE